MAKHHVNVKTGEYGKCEATKIDCPLGEDWEHSDTKEDAIYHSELILAQQYGEFTTMKKRETPAAKDIQPTVNHRYPYPEAHRLERLDTMLHGLRAGEVPPEGISSILGTKPRVSDFYGEAASFLGLAEATVDARGNKAFTLTQDGADYIEQDTAGRQDILKRTVESVDIVQDIRAGEAKEDAVLNRISSTHKESRDTASRKMSSMRSWAKQIQQEEFLQDVDTDDVETRVSDGMEIYNRRYDDAPVQPQQKQGEMCDTCFMEKPLTGVCPNCDE